MPHTASRGRNRHKSRHNAKLVNEQSDDGWSHVVRKGDRHALHTSSSKSSLTLGGIEGSELTELLTIEQVEYYDRISSQTSTKSTGVLRPRPPRYDLKELNEHFGRVQKSFLDSGVAEQVKAVLRRAGLLGQYQDAKVSTGGEVFGSVVQDLASLTLHSDTQSNHGGSSEASSRQRIHNIVCIGLGSASSDQSGWRRVVLWQLAMLIEISRILTSSCKGASAKETRIYAQDPVFNEVDAALLSDFDITILTTPEAFALIDKDTLVYAPHYSIVNWTADMRRGSAACIIGNSVTTALASGRPPRAQELLLFFETVAKKSGYSHELHIPDIHARKELEGFASSHESARWPEPSGAVAEGSFNDTFIYWRSTESE